jgi:hypothetical protein
MAYPSATKDEGKIVIMKPKTGLMAWVGRNNFFLCAVAIFVLWSLLALKWCKNKDANLRFNTEQKAPM